MTAGLRKNRWLRCCYGWTAQVCDPFRFFGAMKGLVWYLADLGAYRRHPGAEPIHFLDTQPELHDRTATHGFDTHYFYVNGWAMRKIVACKPQRHVDVASQAILANLLSAVVPVVFIDYRPLEASLNGLDCRQGSLLSLPLEEGTVESLSCLHVAEHVGLGRYGDPLDPQGTRKAAAELARVLAPGGNLFFAVPVGRPRLCFNAHRVHSAATILDYFTGLKLAEYSGVDDQGVFHEAVTPDAFDECRYACGMFWFRKEG